MITYISSLNFKLLRGLFLEGSGSLHILQSLYSTSSAYQAIGPKKKSDLDSYHVIY